MKAGASRRTAASACWLALSAGGLAGAAPVQAQPAESAASLVPPGGGEDAPITVVVVRHARLGCAAVFERLIHDTFQVRNKTPGHLSTDFLRPTEPGSNAYTIIFKFDRMSHYQQWLDSPERVVWLQRMAQFTEGAPQYQYHPGLEAWVTLPDEPGFHSPDKYKTVAVTWLGIYPLALGVSTLVAPALLNWPTAAATAVTTGIIVPALGYGVMPVMTWLFRDWLYPPAPECKA
jgi:antibiotic biosynthesis monooxygenase (ABM) superfamily enzyme